MVSVRVGRVAVAMLALLVSCAGVLGGGVVTASADPDPMFSVVGTVSVGSGPYDVAVSPDGSRAYASDTIGNSVSVISTATNTVSATVSVGSSPLGVAVTPDGSRVYVTNTSDNSVSVISTATNTVSATVSVGSSPRYVAVTPDGSRVYVTNGSSHSVSVISTATNTVSATVSVGGYPFSVAVSPDGSRVYVTNVDDSSVSVISTATNTVSATVSGGYNPSGVAVSPDGSRVYVANYGGSSVTVISAPASVTAPAAPTSLVATAGNGSASIAFTAGADGGASISKYQYRLGAGSWVDAGLTLPIAITGLANYSTYSIQVRAVNVAGPGAASVAVTARPQSAGPTIGVAYSSGKQGAFVGFGFTRPAGSTLVGFTVRAYAKGTTTVVSSCQTTPSGRSCYIPSLTSGTEYDIRVQAYFTLAGETKVRSSLESATSTVRVNS